MLFTHPEPVIALNRKIHNNTFYQVWLIKSSSSRGKLFSLSYSSRLCALDNDKNNSYGDNNSIIYVQTYIKCTTACYYYALLKYYFDYVIMVDTNRPILSVKYDTITNQHAYTLTMVIKKQYGAIPVNFVSVIFNLEHKQEKLEIPIVSIFSIVSFYFIIYWCYGPTNGFIYSYNNTKQYNQLVL